MLQRAQHRAPAERGEHQAQRAQRHEAPERAVEASGMMPSVSARNSADSTMRAMAYAPAKKTAMTSGRTMRIGVGFLLSRSSGRARSDCGVDERRAVGLLEVAQQRKGDGEIDRHLPQSAKPAGARVRSTEPMTSTQERVNSKSEDAVQPAASSRSMTQRMLIVDAVGSRVHTDGDEGEQPQRHEDHRNAATMRSAGPEWCGALRWGFAHGPTNVHPGRRSLPARRCGRGPRLVPILGERAEPDLRRTCGRASRCRSPPLFEALRQGDLLADRERGSRADRGPDVAARGGEAKVRVVGNLHHLGNGAGGQPVVGRARAAIIGALGGKLGIAGCACCCATERGDGACGGRTMARPATTSTPKAAMTMKATIALAARLGQGSAPPSGNNATQ